MKVKTAELAEALGVSQRSIVKRSQKEQWRPTGEKIRGGGNVYALDTLPQDVQAAIIALRQKNILSEAVVEPIAIAMDTAAIAVAATPSLPAIPGQAIPVKAQKPVAVSDAKKSKAMAKYELVRVYTAHLAKVGWKNKVAARDEFIVRYLAGEWPAIKAILGDLSWKTVEAWKVTVRNAAGDPLALADSRGGHLRGTTKLTSEQMQILRTFALHPNKMRISHAITWARRVMKERCIDTASDATCRRYILSLKNSDYPAWVFYREGEQALENKCGYTLERDYDKLAVGDQLTADGHVLNFTVLNPWTGKPCRPTLILWYDTRSNMPLGWELMPTENTQAIHVALRRAIIALGKVPKVAYLDNGRAFRSEHFTSSEDFDNGAIAGLYARLGIVTSFATPYHGQSKTVERFFGSLLEMESILPTYVGTSNQNKPARMHRGESLHRKLWEKYGMARVAVTMEQAHHIIAAWFDEYAHRPQRGHLNGKSPMEIFQPGRGPGVDRALLTELMMSVKITKIQKTGIKMFGQTYYHPALYGRRDPVVVRHDMMDREYLYIYETSGEFLCCAEPKSKTHPCARILGDDGDKEVLLQELATKNRIKTMTVGPARELLQTEILPEFSRLTAAIGVESQALPKPERSKSGKVISLAGARKPIAIPASFDYQQALEEAAENAALQAEIEARDFDANLEQLSEADRYEELIKLTCQGKQLAPKWTGFMSLYEQSAEYDRFREYWESCWTNCRLLYGPMEQEAGQAQAYTARA